MPQPRYKAFISYSHRDERWGRWLQRSLESYRVPRRLVGADGRFGPVPARLTPVFRDREDLSSAADLTTSVKKELAASETLVVICSPAAAASRWVNEEVEYFRALGRGDRILALIVDGDPQADDPARQCFPPALLRDAGGRRSEPLAADARPSADGKTLSRLKLVSGILGIRLDDLRQRDMQRRHRLWMISAGGAMAVAVVTTVLAIVAVTARNQAENRRQHAENLVDYMVDDLKRKLDEVGRLDILEGVGDEVSKYLETLDPREETEESLLQKVKVWRQLGQVSVSQAELDEAMAAFRESRELTRELLRRAPRDLNRIYEMAQAEYWVGYLHLEKGEYEAARRAFDAYLGYADLLVQLEPDDPEWLMEQSYAHGNIATLLIRRNSNDVEQILREVEIATELNRRVVALEPDNAAYLSELGNALAWMADTQRLFCDLGGALKTRQEYVAIAGRLVEAEPGNANLRRRYAYSLTGLANVARQIGLSAYALERLEDAADIQSEIYAVDPTNLDTRWDQLRVEVLIALLRAEVDGFDFALERLARLYEPMRELVGGNVRQRQEWVDYLLRYAQLAGWAGEEALAADLRGQASESLQRWAGTEGSSAEWQNEIIFARFLHWEQAGDPAGAEGPLATPAVGEARLPEAGSDAERAQMSCEDRSLRVLRALLAGETQRARADTEYLLGKGYYEPGFVRICQRYGLCRKGS